MTTKRRLVRLRPVTAPTIEVERLPDPYMSLRRFTDAEEQQIADEYVAGDTIPALAARYACSTYTIREALRRCGVQPRSPSQQQRRLSDADIMAIRSAYSAGGVTQAALAQRYGVAAATISMIVTGVMRQHLPLLPPPPPPQREPYYNINGYLMVNVPGHPLAIRRNAIRLHRVVLYDKIGPGPHPCTWCGKLLEWDVDLHTDHLNEIRDDNRPENLVVSCRRCNAARGTRRLERRLRMLAHWLQNQRRLEAEGLWSYVNMPPRPHVARSPRGNTRYRLIINAYREGATVNALAQQFGTTDEEIRKVLLVAGGIDLAPQTTTPARF